MKMLINNFLRDEEGASLVEYAILAALISVVAIAIIGDVGTKVKDTFTSINNKLVGVGA